MTDGTGSRIVRVALLFYLPMCALAPLAGPPGTLRAPPGTALWAGLGAALAIGGLTVWLSRLAARHTGWGRRLHAELHAALGTALSSRHILLLALLSAFGEEILFRGVLLHYTGLWISSALFAVLHFPYRPSLRPWSLFALVMGLALGWLTQWSATLWPAVLVHFLVNYVNLHALREPPAQPPGEGADAAPDAPDEHPRDDTSP